MDQCEYYVTDEDGEEGHFLTKKEDAIALAKELALSGGVNYEVYKRIGVAKAPSTIEFVEF